MTQIQEGDFCMCNQCGKEFTVQTGSPICMHTLDNSGRWIDPTKVILLRRATPPVDERPVLGRDRAGREVRRLDKVRCGCTCPQLCQYGMPGRMHFDGGYAVGFDHEGFDVNDTPDQTGGYIVRAEWAELVTDEKAEPTDLLICRCGGIPFAGHGFCSILESTCRALAGPTLAERYAEFRQTVASIISTSCADLDVEAVTDVAKEQFLLRLRIGPDWEQSLWWPSRGPWEAVRAEINRSVKIVEIELGRKALKKARVLGKGDEAQLASGKAMNALKDSAREAVETKP